MKSDEFAFFNQQLAAMIRDGIPLEAALRRLCAEMRGGLLRSELEKLEADLAKGTPLREAVQKRQLPELYRQMLEVGARSQDLPGILTLLADHYQRRHVLAARLKGLMVYPVIVLCGCFVLALALSIIFSKILLGIFPFAWIEGPSTVNRPLLMSMWAPPVIFGVGTLVLGAALATPSVRRVLRWRLPAFKSAALAQVASALALMLKSGVPLNNALELAAQLEAGSPAEGELTRWRQRLAAGQGKPSEMMAGGRVFPPLFAWTVAQSGEDLAGGFHRAAETYQSRASYQSDLLLYAALPCSVLGLGAVILLQVEPVLSTLGSIMSALGSIVSSISQ